MATPSQDDVKSWVIAAPRLKDAASSHPVARNPENAHRRRRLLILAGVCIAGFTLGALFLQSRTPTAAAWVGVATFENLTGDSLLNTLGVTAADWITGGMQQTVLLDVVRQSWQRDSARESVR